MLILCTLDTEEQKRQFLEIYQSNYRLMYHIALKVLKNQQEAEDVVHSAFVKLAEKFEKYEHLSCSEMSSLCVIIVKNKALDFLRTSKNGRQTDIEELSFLLMSDEKSPLEQVLDQEKSDEMNQALHKLPEILRIVLELKYYHEYTNGEIADILDITKKNVEMRLYRAKQKLKEVLQSEEDA